MRREIEELDEDFEVRAAGGLVVDSSGDEVTIAVVHRPRHDDWSLPKGKLDPGESWEEAARREVAEETGFDCELAEELEPARYRDRHGRSKIVRFWRMRPLSGEFEPGEEVDELRWLRVGEAVGLLSYDHDRILVQGLESGGPKTNV